MQIYEYGKVQLPHGACTLAIGFFDGVHLAHRSLITRAVERARELSVPSGVFTFSPNGAIKGGVGKIYSLEQRLSLIESLGVDFCIVADFEDIRNMSAEEFCEGVLIGSGCLAAVVGYNFRFGRGATADAEALAEIMKKSGGEAIIIPEKKLFGKSISSSNIRAYLEAGAMKEAAAMLGEEYFITGEVIHGRGVGGRRLGSPTANLSHPEGLLLPRLGVYAARAEIEGVTYPAAANLGTCPTFGGMAPHTEAYIIGYQGDLYGKKIKLSFISFLRDEKRFLSENELKMQIEIDKNAIIKEFNGKND